MCRCGEELAGEVGLGRVNREIPAHTLAFYDLQARDDILNGSHPVSFDKACEFAGFQCQIQFGPHNEQKHKAGFLE